MPLAYLVEQFRTLTYLLPAPLENDVGSFQEHIRGDRSVAKKVIHNCTNRQMKPLSQLRFVTSEYASVLQGRLVRFRRLGRQLAAGQTLQATDVPKKA
jgi:hypothetical protein